MATYVVAFALLIACGGSDEQVAQTEHFAVRIRSEAQGVGEHDIIIDIRERVNPSVTVEEVVVAPTMRDMGMASPEVIATADASGRYRAKQVWFSMGGEWEVEVRIRTTTFEDIAIFRIQVN
ncbi:MAG TPA: FixH family protein [Roseiflexaceae bacterium]|nr:FixH family protein [Roseiflexaceae bacterium]